MSTKVKRKVTVENSKESDEPRRPSVFERLGPGAANVPPQPAERHTRTAEHNEKCRNWLRNGVCMYGSACRYTHKVPSTSRQAAKPEKEMEVKDLRHKVKTKRDDRKESRKNSTSPKRKSSKRSRSRSRKGDHEGKIKSTVVVTRPRSPAAMAEGTNEPKKKPENWEDDSDDWPMDAAQLDYKEELTLERKRQQLQRELELELQKERLLNEGVTITKTVSFSESSSTTSSSDSGSLSSSSESTSSSSEGDSNETSSSSSSSSSSSPSRQQPIAKRKSKKKEVSSSRGAKSLKKEEEKAKRSAKSSKKARSPSVEARKGARKGKVRERNASPPVLTKKRHSDGRSEGKSGVRVKGPRTPSPVQKSSRKQRQWAQSSSADSRTADMQRSKGKRHKKKKDAPREKRKSDRILSPPPLSSPNRLALLPAPSKKSKSRNESRSKSRRRHREPSPMLPPHASSANAQPIKMPRYPPDDKPTDKIRSTADDRGRSHKRGDTEDLLPPHKRPDSQSKRLRGVSPPRKDLRKASLSPPPMKDRYDNEAINRKLYAVAHEKEKGMDRRRSSVSPGRSSDRRKMALEIEKKRDIRESPPHDSRREGLYRGAEAHGYEKRGVEVKAKRFVSPEIKKSREDKSREHVKDRGVDYDAPSWQGDHRKPGSSSSGRRTPEPRGRQEMRSQAPLLRSDRSRERDSDRKKSSVKKLSVRSIDDPERARLPSPRRSESPLHGHLAVREIESLTGTRGRIYESDLPPADREYAYGYDSLHDPFLSERLLPPEYESDVLRGPSVYPSDVYSESRYRRGTKDPLDRYEARDISPRDVLPHRDIISLTGRGDDYLPDLPIEERSYEDRWPRGRARDDWDPYPAITPAPLPPHVAAALDEDRYGMPRRRRASPSEPWARSRIEERDAAINPTHRPAGRGPPPPREGRSRSPGTKTSASNRGSWNERSGRHDRSIESRQHEEAQKNVDDRKGRPPVKKEKMKPKAESSVEDKAPTSFKEKAPVKRPHSPSPSPQNKPKKRRNDIQDFDILKYHGGSENSNKKASPAPPKKVKEEPKSGSKTTTSSTRAQKSADAVKKESESKASADGKLPTSSKEKTTVPASKVNKNRRNDIQDLDILKYHGCNSNSKTGKQETPPPKNEPLSATEKSDIANKSSSDNKTKEKDIKKSRKTDDNTRGEDEFSDWSDDDDDLLTRDDFTESIGNSEKGRHKADESFEGNSRRREKHSLKESQDFRRDKEMTGGRDRSNDEASKDNKSISDIKETDIHESLSVKEDTATDVDEYITAESVDYDPISDDELDALIEEPDETLLKPAVENEKSKIVDALDVNWSAIMSETKTEFVPGFARQRFRAAHVLSRIGFSQALAGSELSEKIIALCQKQLDEEVDKNEDGTVKSEGVPKEEKKFVMEHSLAAFHVSISQNKRERINLFSKVGPYRRALCARRDLQIRKILCKPLNKLPAVPTVSFPPQYTVVDKDLYKQSLELLKLKKTPEIAVDSSVTPPTVDVC